MSAQPLEPDPAPAPPSDAADPGFFGPGSITWRIMGDPSMAVAGLRAIFLQSLHPLAMDGVARFSSFETDPWGRLVRTGEFVGVTTYGSTEEAEAIAARVRALHDRLSRQPAVEPTTGRSYRVNDPDLLRWVHISEVDSFLRVAQRAGVGLTPDEADRYVAEQVASARLIGLDPATVPQSVAELSEHLRRARPDLRSTPASRRTVAFALFPPMKPWVALATPARPAWVGLETLAFSLLPRWARRLHGAPGLPSTDVTATVALRALRIGLVRWPDSVREGPHRRAARERLGLPSAWS